jgi:hypothetical protein
MKEKGGRREEGKYRRTRVEGREIGRSMDSITPAARNFLSFALRDLSADRNIALTFTSFLLLPFPSLPYTPLLPFRPHLIPCLISSSLPPLTPP